MRRKIFLAFISALLMAQTSDAQEAIWTNSAGGNFQTGSNWDTGSKPGSTDKATFSLGDTYGVTLNATENVRRIDIQNGDVTFSGGNAINVMGSGIFDGYSYVESGSVLRVSGTDTKLNTWKSLYARNGGDVHVENGGTVNVGNDPSTFSSSQGHIVVSGTSSLAWTPLLVAQNGSIVTSGDFVISALSSGSKGTIVSRGPGSELNFGGDAFFAYRGNSILSVDTEGTLTNNNAFLGYFASSNATAYVDDGTWTNNGNLEVGRYGSADLEITNGGVVENDTGTVGAQSTGTGTVLVSGVDSKWNNSRLLMGTGNGTDDRGVGSLAIESGGVVNVGNVIANSLSNANGLLHVGDSNGTAEVVARNGSTVNTSFTYVGENAGTAGSIKVDGAGSSLTNAGTIALGENGYGAFELSNGAEALTSQLEMGDDTGSADLTVSEDSELIIGNWLHAQNSTIDLSGSTKGVGIYLGDGYDSSGAGLALSRELRAINTTIHATSAQLGQFGRLNVDSGSQLDVDGATNIDARILEASNGSQLNLDDVQIGGLSGSGNAQGRSVVDSHWQVAGDLAVGTGSVTGSLEITDTSSVNVSGRTSIGANGSASLDGGTFDFGITDSESFARITGSSGTLLGTLENDGYTHINNYGSNGSLDTTGVTATNTTGVIYGSGVTNKTLTNMAAAEVRTQSNEWSRFSGAGNTNSGEINSFGGVTEFENDLTNLADGEINNFGGTFMADNLINDVSGFISGRGEFITNGITNNGVMAFSGGFTDIHGDLQNLGDGIIVTAGDGVTTFYDDVVHNGQEVHTAAGSHTVYFGEFSGSGAHTGAGDVFMQGDFRPGNSPDVLTFEGNLHLGTNSNTFIEMLGTGYGDFDRLEVAGNMTINGLLDVESIDGFLLSQGDFFEIIDIGGDAFGEFIGLAEGDVVTNLNGVDLFISYQWGDGNNVALFTAVPEPGSAAISVVFLAAIAVHRKRQVL